MRLFLLILFVGLVLSEEEVTKEVEKKADDVKDTKTAVEEPKSKTEKRDYSDQTGSYGLSTNDEPFKPMLTSNTGVYDAAASATQQVYYDKSQLTAADEEANTKGTINRQAANSYREPYSRVVNQQQPQQYYQQQQIQQQQQQQYKHNLRLAGKNAGIQENQPSILYAEPHHAAYNYEKIPQQQQQQQQQQQPAQRGQQKQIQYVIAIPISYLRQLQQQILYQQQQEQSPHLQTHKGQQQPVHQQQQQQQQQPIYSIAGPLARDHQGSYRPFHRFSPAAVNDVPASPSGQHRSAASPLQPASAAPPGYITQYIQIPASVLLAAAQSAQVQQRPFNIQHQAAYQQQPSPQHHQQNTQAQSPQLYYYQPQQHQQQQQQHYQQQPQLKQSQTSHVLTPPPLYAYNVQQQSGTQQQIAVQHIPVYQQQLQYQQQTNVDRQQQLQQHRSRPAQHGAQPTAQTYEHEQTQLASIHAQSLEHAHNQQPAPVAQSPAPGHKLVPAITQAQAPAPGEGYAHIVHYNPQYLQQYIQQPQQQQQIQQQRVKYQQQHRLQVQHPHQHQQQVALVDNLSNSPYTQGIHGPTPLPYVSLQPPAAVTPHTHSAPQPSQLTPYYNYNLVSNGVHPQFIANAVQPSFAPLGSPSKVTSYTNVLLQPFVGHHSSSYQIPEMGSAGAASSNSLPFYNHHTGGIHYGTHLYHPPTPPSPITSNQQHNTVSAAASGAHHAAAQPPKAATKSAKASTTAGGQTIVKYP